MERFWAKVNKTDTCWLWTACKKADGYGQIGVGGGKLKSAHRLSYEMHVGPIPPGLVIDHLCRIRHCVNPAHMEAVTPQVNTARGIGGHNMSAKTHCPSGHAYTPDNIVRRADRKRSCRTCCNARQLAAYYARKSVA
jgi:hypothetical protein